MHVRRRHAMIWGIIALFAFCLALVPAAHAGKSILPSQPAATMPPLHVSGRDIVDPNGQRVMLRGIAIPDLQYVNTYRRGGVPALIDLVAGSSTPVDHRGWSPRVLRLPVYPEPDDAVDTPGWIADPNGYFTNHLDPAVRHCISKQIYCIIDWHWVTSYLENDEGDLAGHNEVITGDRPQEISDATKAFWRVVAAKYKNHPNVIFELFNEPIYPSGWNKWRPVAQDWVDVIRGEVGANNIIIVGAPEWSLNNTGAITNPITSANIVYSSHIYPGHTLPKPSGTLDVSGQLTKWNQWFGATTQTLPVMITEFGWEPCGHYDSAARKCDNHPVAGTTAKFGTRFKNYIEPSGAAPRVAGWTAWVADYCLGPLMFDQDRNLMGVEAAEVNLYQGGTIVNWLQEKSTDYFPTPTGTSTGVEYPMQLPRQSPTCDFDWGGM